MPDYVFSLNWKRVTAYEKKSYIIEGTEYSEKEFLTIYNAKQL